MAIATHRAVRNGPLPLGIGVWQRLWLAGTGLISFVNLRLPYKLTYGDSNGVQILVSGRMG